MAVVHYTVTESSSGKTLMVVVDGQHYAYSASHPGQSTTLEAIAAMEQDILTSDEVAEVVENTHSPAKVVNTALRSVSTRFSYFNRQLRFDGDVIDKRITRLIVDRIKGGDHNWQSLAKFMVRLAQNPSQASRRALYRWISDRHLTITTDGLIVGYKGVADNGRSIHKGKGIIHSLNAEGDVTTEYIDYDSLPNQPGTWVEFPRAEVNPDPSNGCSLGLHVGTADYARAFGHRLLTVLVDPAAVVMVPNDSEGQKMRVWQYYVTDIEPRTAYATHTLEAPVAFGDDFDDDESIDDDLDDDLDDFDEFHDFG